MKGEEKRKIKVSALVWKLAEAGKGNNRCSRKRNEKERNREKKGKKKGDG